MIGNEHVIEVVAVSKRFRIFRALKGVDLVVRQGSHHGCVGLKKAGKTTLNSILLGQYPLYSGQVQVLKMDPRRDGPKIRSKIGYLPQNPLYPRWMTVARVIRFYSLFYDTWDMSLCKTLVKRLQLPVNKKIQKLPRIMLANLSLVLALSHKPSLFILDDPTRDLNATGRLKFLEVVDELIMTDFQTVFFTTRSVTDIEMFADEITFLHRGRVKLSGKATDVKARFRKIHVSFPDSAPEQLDITGMSLVNKEGKSCQVIADNYSPGAELQLYEAGASHFEVSSMSFKEIVAYVTASK